jgi:hypothetical protein
MSGGTERLRAIELAFYEASKHVPAKDGHCKKCGFCHCEVGHVLAMAQQGVEAALAAERTNGVPCPSQMNQLNGRLELTTDQSDVALAHSCFISRPAPSSEAGARVPLENAIGWAESGKVPPPSVVNVWRRTLAEMPPPTKGDNFPK